MTEPDPDMDDEDRAIIDHAPPRRALETISVDAAARQPAAGALARMRQAAQPSLQEFYSFRGPLGATRIALGHVPILQSVWRLWAAKRAQGSPEVGVSALEVVEDSGATLSHVRHVVNSLIRNEALVATTRYIGFRGTRALYSPTDAGVQALALMAVLPMGSQVQVGRTPSAWRSRRTTEPSNLFQHAALLRGGADAPPFDPEYA